jgi:hypothetical protein
MKKVVFILSDALCGEYIEEFNLEFIKNTKSSKIEKIYPSTGYCEIVEYVTGMDSEEHQMLTQVNAVQDWYKNKIPWKVKFIDVIFNGKFWKIPKIKGFHKIYIYDLLSRYLENFYKKSLINVRYGIPIQFLSFFEPIESQYDYDSYLFGGDKNLFQQLIEKKVSYDISDFVEHNKIKGSDNSRLENLKNKIQNKKLKDFTLLYIGFGEIAHVLGSKDEKFKKTMQAYDKKLQDIYSTLKDKYLDFDLIILGDHGMIDVTHHVDILKTFKEVIKDYDQNLKLFKDYIYFIDSTMFRVWFKDSKHSVCFEKKLKNNIDISKYIENSKKTDSYLNKFKPKFGEIILLLKPGNIFYPDFYNNKANKGMHGYLNNYERQQGVMIHFSSGSVKANVKEAKLSEMKNYVLDIYEKI